MLHADSAIHRPVAAFGECGVLARTIQRDVVAVIASAAGGIQRLIHVASDVTALQVVLGHSECSSGVLVVAGTKAGTVYVFDPHLGEDRLPTLAASGCVSKGTPVKSLAALRRGRETNVWALCGAQLGLVRVAPLPRVQSFNSMDGVDSSSASSFLRKTGASNQGDLTCVVECRVKVSAGFKRIAASPRSSQGLGALIGPTEVDFVRGLDRVGLPEVLESVDLPPKERTEDNKAVDAFTDVCFDPLYAEVAWVATRFAVRQVDLGLGGRLCREALWCTRPCDFGRVFSGRSSLLSTTGIPGPKMPAIFSQDSDDRLTAWMPRDTAFDSYCAPIVTGSQSKPKFRPTVVQCKTRSETFAVCFDDGSTGFWSFDVQTQLWEAHRFVEAAPQIGSLLCTADDKLVVTDRVTNSVCLLDARSGIVTQELRPVPYVKMVAAAAAAEDSIWIAGHREGNRGVRTHQVTSVALSSGELEDIVRPADGPHSASRLHRAVPDAMGRLMLLVFDEAWEVWELPTRRCLNSATFHAEDTELVTWSPVGRAIDPSYPVYQCVCVVERGGVVRFKDAVGGKANSVFRNAGFNRMSDVPVTAACAVGEIMAFGDAKGGLWAATVRAAGQPSFVNALSTAPGNPVADIKPAPGPLPVELLIAVRFTNGSMGVWDAGSRSRMSFRPAGGDSSNAAVVDLHWVDDAHLAVLLDSAQIIILAVADLRPVALPVLSRAPSAANDAKPAQGKPDAIDMAWAAGGAWLPGASWRSLSRRTDMRACANNLFGDDVSPSLSADRMALLCSSLCASGSDRIFGHVAQAYDPKREPLVVRPVDQIDVVTADRACLVGLATRLSHQRAAVAHEFSTTMPLTGDCHFVVARGFLRVGLFSDACDALLAIDHEDPRFESACNLACAIASAAGANPLGALTAKRAAAKQMVAGRIEDAIDKFAMMGQFRDGAETLISRGRFADAAMFAAVAVPSVDETEATSVRRFALCTFAVASLQGEDYTTAVRVCAAMGEFWAALVLLHVAARAGTVPPQIPSLLALWISAFKPVAGTKTVAECVGTGFETVLNSPVTRTLGNGTVAELVDAVLAWVPSDAVDPCAVGWGSLRQAANQRSGAASATE